MAKKKAARRRSVRRAASRVKRRASRSKGLGKFINLLEGPVATGAIAIKQMVGKDIDAAPWASWPTETKAKFVIHKVVGRMTGLNPFPDTFATQKMTINPSAAINTFSILGAVGLAATTLVKQNFPFKAHVKRLSKSALTGGIVGGFFDPLPGENLGGSTAQRQVSGQSMNTAALRVGRGL